jgi:uncharacterized SAM-binding protein YcdF (DUF218 family)
MLFWLKKTVSFWLMPLPVCLTLMIAGLALTRHERRRRLGRILLTTGLALLIAFSNKAVSRWLIAPLEAVYPPIPELAQPSPVPAELAACRYIVVLGGGHGDMPGLAATNKLSTSGIGRLAEGARLARALPDATVIVSGPSDGRGETHARVLARAAESLGLPCPADYRGKSNPDFRWTDYSWDSDSLDRSTFAVRESIGYFWVWLRGKV